MKFMNITHRKKSIKLIKIVYIENKQTKTLYHLLHNNFLICLNQDESWGFNAEELINELTVKPFHFHITSDDLDCIYTPNDIILKKVVLVTCRKIDEIYPAILNDYPELLI